MPRLSIILPTYNERENLVPLVGRIQAALQNTPVEWEILVVDDNSPDGTAQAAEELSKEFPVRVLIRKENKGLARAVLAGFRIATGDFLLVMDADLSHPPERIPEMWDIVTGNSCDLVVGSRYVSGGAILDWPMLRRLTSRISRMLVHPLTQIKDPLSGFFLVRREVVENGSFNAAGFKILLEILVKGRCKGVREIPITFQERVHGSSKLSQRVVLEYLLQVIRLYTQRAVSFLKSP